MTLDDLTAEVGLANFEQASLDARERAPGTESRSGRDRGLSDAMQLIYDALLYARLNKLSDEELVALFCELFERAPSYTWLFTLDITVRTKTGVAKRKCISGVSLSEAVL